MAEFNAYIDESGDEGIDTGGTDWFMIGAVVVPKELDLQLARKVDEVKALIEQKNLSRALHWQDFHRHHHKRLAIIQALAQIPFTLVVCGVHKPSLDRPERLKGGQRLYNYLTRHVLERVSWFVRDTSGGRGFCNLYFENRSTMSYPALAAYLERVKREKGSRIVGHVLGPPIPRGKQEKKNLQVADCCVGACYAALEPHRRWKTTDPSYVMHLAERFYHRDANLLSYGLKLLPSTKQEDFLMSYDWLHSVQEKIKRAPGSRIPRILALPSA